MGKSDFDYLDDERKKTWHKLNSIETELHSRIDDEISKLPLSYLNEAKQASKKVSEFKNKSEESKNAITQYLSEVETNVRLTKQQFEAFQALKESISQEIQGAKNNAAQIKAIADEIGLRKDDIEGDVQSLEDIFENFDDLSEKVGKLQDTLTNSNDTSSKIETLHKLLLTRKKEIDQLYYDIFGYTDTTILGTETEVEGLKNKLENAYSDLTQEIETSLNKIIEIKEKTLIDYESLQKTSKSNYEQHALNWDLRYLAIEAKIEALLPNALTAGLSSAYSEKKVVELAEYSKLNKTFVTAIFGLIFVSIIPLAVSYFSLINNKAFEKVLLDMPRLVLSILPLYVPVLWVAYSSNRKMNLSKRLSEEYSHKEVLSKTFEGLSTQINNISDQKTSEDLRNKLLYNILEVSSENPGKLISDYNKSDHPLMDALDKSVKLAAAFEKLEKIPGLAKLANKMNQKSKAIISDEDEKAKRGIDAIDDEDEKLV